MMKRVSLDGQWNFRSKSSGIWKHGNVPGCVQMDLINLGELHDPYYRMNEIEFHKIEKEEWIYKKNFAWDGSPAGNKNIFLVFEGIDTLANVYLNGRHLGRAEDMFITYRFDVKDIIKSGENIVEIYFDSPVQTIEVMKQNSPVSLNSANQFARPYVRKAQYSYGWDWGQRMTQTGLWKSVYLELVDAARIQFPFFDTLKIGRDFAAIHVGAEVEVFTCERLSAAIEISINGCAILQKALELQNLHGQWSVEWEGTIENPSLWYPNGMGGQPLYDIRLTVNFNGEIADECKFSAGIRTVRLIQEKDEEGKTFIFEINGQKVFAKGADWIPGDSLLPKLTDEYYHSYMKMAKDANMNMIRVWGGGIYESPAFYKACNELGLMVWQDFTYACSEYPDQFEWFQKLARQEAEYVVKSMRHYTSLVL